LLAAIEFAALNYHLPSNLLVDLRYTMYKTRSRPILCGHGLWNEIERIKVGKRIMVPYHQDLSLWMITTFRSRVTLLTRRKPLLSSLRL